MVGLYIYFYVSLFVIVAGAFTFVSSYGHFLSNILCLDMMGTGLYVLLMLKASGFLEEGSLGIYYLIFLVCESVLGLALLVGFCWGYGQDFVKGFSSSVC